MRYFLVISFSSIFEAPHDKTSKMTCAQPRLRSALALTKSGQSLWVAKDPNFLKADREDSDADLSSLSANVILLVLSCIDFNFHNTCKE